MEPQTEKTHPPDERDPVAANTRPIGVFPECSLIAIVSTAHLPPAIARELEADGECNLLAGCTPYRWIFYSSGIDEGLESPPEEVLASCAQRMPTPW